METLNIKLPYSDWTLIFDSIRHYIKYILIQQQKNDPLSNAPIIAELMFCMNITTVYS